jgi:hypothetical protein
VFDDINYIGDLFAGGRDVAATNVGLTLLLAFFLLAGGALFNEALEENSDKIRFMPRQIPTALGPVAHRWHRAWGTVTSAWASAIPGNTWIDRAVSPLALLALTGLIYTFLEPVSASTSRASSCSSVLW